MPEKKLSSRIVHNGHLRLKIDTVLLPDGTKSSREVVEHPEVVAIVAVDDKDNALMVTQFRYALGKDLLEIPAGGIDGNETPEDAVRREMQEETGFLPKKIVRLGGFYSAPGFTDEYLYLYLATGLVPSRLYAEDTDGIKLERIPVKDIPALVTSGRIQDAKSLAGLLTYLEYRKKHKKKE